MKQCVLCSEPLKYDIAWRDIWRFCPIMFEEVCTPCQQRFPLYQVSGTICAGCNRPLAEDNVFNQIYRYEEDTYCFDCLRWVQRYPTEWVRHRAILAYNDDVREWLYQYKYRMNHRLSQVMKKILQTYYSEHRDAAWLILPSSHNSLLERGFHATGYLLETAQIPYYCPFDYVGDGNKQAKKNRRDRLLLQQPFAINTTILSEISAQKRLLFDDVYTTGATLLKAKQLLYEARPKGVQIESVSLARDTLLVDENEVEY